MGQGGDEKKSPRLTLPTIASKLVTGHGSRGVST